MTNLTRLLVPLGLGLLAAVFVFAAVHPQLGEEFVIVKGPVAGNQPLVESNLSPFKIVGEEFSRLSQTLVPWADRASILGLPSKRELQKGDFVFWQDVQYASADFALDEGELPLHMSLEGVDYEPSLLKVGNELGLIVPVASDTGRPASASRAQAAPQDLKFNELGPFRILSVGQRTLSDPVGADAGQLRGNAHIVTLAVKDAAPRRGSSTTSSTRPLPESIQALLAAKSQRRSDGKNIAAMVLYQNTDKAHGRGENKK